MGIFAKIFGSDDTKYRELLAEIERQKLEIANLQASLAAVEQERDDLRVKLAQKNNRGAGRKPIGDDVVAEILRLKKDGYTVRDISAQVGVSVATVSRYANS